MFGGFLLSFWYAPDLYAHAGLKETSPENGEVVKRAPEKVSLRFNEPIERNLSQIQLYDWNGRQIHLPNNREGGRSQQLNQGLPYLKTGTYTVVWNVVSLDGHPVEGSYSFSVRKEVGGEVDVPEKEAGMADGLLVVARYLVEGMLLLGAGLYGMAWLAEKRGLPGFAYILGRARWVGGGLLLLGTLVEAVAYSATLTNVNLFELWLDGKWSLLFQFPFVLMLFTQLVLILLLILPGMTRAWYLFLWMVLASAPAIGGHVWGMESPLTATLLRVIHLLAIAAWLGSLTYLVLVLLWKRRTGGEADLSRIRAFFVPTALISALTVLASGVWMVGFQSDWTQVLASRQAWAVLLFIKFLLTGVMLFLALVQTLRWKREGRSPAGRWLQVEWAAGLIALLAGVWMSQSVYPVPMESYHAALETEQTKAVVKIPQLGLGNQTMKIRLPEKEKPKRVRVDLAMKEHGMKIPPVLAEPMGGTGHYQAKVPFSMVGKWQFTIIAEYPGGKEKHWSAEIFIPGGGE
ncbi:copper resistance CopC/CopD family protein [Salinithrix halophila]|uniref:Copper resistance protein CopC n=1 Tax=Salinithrix halophila TaxID=1485204 RepID=A0ABV8JBM9_9BACL